MKARACNHQTLEFKYSHTRIFRVAERERERERERVECQREKTPFPQFVHTTLLTHILYKTQVYTIRGGLVLIRMYDTSQYVLRMRKVIQKGVYRVGMTKVEGVVGKRCMRGYEYRRRW